MDMIAARTECLEYLAANAEGRQGEIAETIGLRRETVNRYVGGHAVPTDIECVQKIYDWMLTDRKKRNGAKQK